jgi:hypothetical protein
LKYQVLEQEILIFQDLPPAFTLFPMPLPDDEVNVPDLPHNRSHNIITPYCLLPLSQEKPQIIFKVAETVFSEIKIMF